MRRYWMLVAAIVLAAGSTAGAFEDPHGVGYDGHDWKAMSEQAKLAYVAGFLAGSAADQAVRMHQANPKLSVDAAVAQIIRGHTGAFPYSVNVYKNRLDDYYFDVPNQPDKIFHAIVRETETIKENTR